MNNSLAVLKTENLLKSQDMNFPERQIEELKKIAPSLSIAQEGGFTYFLIEKLQLPDGCEPPIVDALLCPSQKNGYESTLFYSSNITGCPPLNWNRLNVRILDRNWFAVSWQVRSGLRLAEMLLIHLNALRK